MLDATQIPATGPIYDPDDYAAAQRLGRMVKQERHPELLYRSVRRPGADCWALMRPTPC